MRHTFQPSLSFRILLSLTTLTLCGCIYNSDSIVHPETTQATKNSDITLAISVEPARGMMLDINDYVVAEVFGSNPRAFKDHQDILNLLKPYKTKDERENHSEFVYTTFLPPIVPGQAWRPLRLGRSKPIDQNGSRSFQVKWIAGSYPLGYLRYEFELDPVSHNTCEDLLSYESLALTKPDAFVDLQERDGRLRMIGIRPTAHPKPYVGDDPC